jgi:pimeloyl-ACP methyl ester carboxylesterase
MLNAVVARGGRHMTIQPTLYQTEIGTDGPTLVFLHGVGGTTRYWERRVASLATTNRLLLVDLLGYGRSPKPWTTYSVERHVVELRRVLTERERLTLVGHSFGAIVAVAYAARYPAQVERLILLSLPYWGSEVRAKRFFRQHATLESWFMTNIVLTTIACILTRRLLRRALPYVLKDMPREVVEDLVQHTWRSSTSTIWDGIYRYDLAGDAGRLPPELPVLLVHGDRDTTAPLEGARRLAARHRNSMMLVLPGVDHHPLLRDPTHMTEVMQTFSASGTPPRSPYAPEVRTLVVPGMLSPVVGAGAFS